MMKVNAVSFSAAKVPAVALNQTKVSRLEPIKYDNKLKMVDVLPISGLLGASLMSIYFIKKGNLDIAMKAMRV